MSLLRYGMFALLPSLSSSRLVPAVQLREDAHLTCLCAFVVEEIVGQLRSDTGEKIDERVHESWRAGYFKPRGKDFMDPLKIAPLLRVAGTEVVESDYVCYAT